MKFRLVPAMLLAAIAFTSVPLAAQTGTKNGEWRTYGGDLGNTKYAPLDQINASNFDKLRVAWRFNTSNLGSMPEYNFEATPLMVGGVMYTVAGSRRDVVALDPANGEMLWMYRENEGERGEAAPRRLSGRGLSYWTDGREERILFVTPGYRLIALNAKTGQRIPDFGQSGVVDLKMEDDQQIDLITGEVGLHAAPTIAGNTIIIGAAHLAGNAPKTMKNVKGYIRAFDVKTGKRLWIFHTIPRPGEFGYNTWENDSAENNGNTGAWGQISVDEELGLVYVPVEMATGDYYGGHRPGNALFAESIVALDLKTGQRKWHYQLVHHGIWDWDIPCAPMLVDFQLNGRTIKAVAQPTKQSILYVFDRATGQPIWPIQERPVPQGDVPGEKYSPTQPFPTAPPPYGRIDTSIDELIDFTPALRAEAIKIASKYKLGPLFTPPVVSKPEGPLATLVAGCCQGGTGWAGGSYDPQRHVLYTYTQAAVGPISLLPGKKEQTDMAYVRGTATPVGGPAPLNVQGLPLFKPPYGSIVAIDLDAGKILWSVPHGETPDEVRNHPALKGLTIPRTGRAGLVGTLTTASLVIAGERLVFTNAQGQKGAMLRAYDKATGKDAGAVMMPAGNIGSPMTYMLNGKQYIVLAIAGQGFAGELIAYTLPN